MNRSLCVALVFLAAACASAKAKDVTPPSAAAAACPKSSATIYLLDGQPISCTAAMSVPASRIASVEVLKGPAAIALYGPAAAPGVVVIETKQYH
jgi:TonB-dependent SusC/RagA subfamily outer membrane receptor